MDKVFIKKNTLGDTRTAEYMPSREEFNDANERHIDDVKNLTRSFCDEMLERISQHDANIGTRGSAVMIGTGEAMTQFATISNWIMTR